MRTSSKARSTGELLTTARLYTACELLRNSDLGITDIALTSGFGDQSYFQKAFKRHTGMTRSRFRRDREATLSRGT